MSNVTLAISQLFVPEEKTRTLLTKDSAIEDPCVVYEHASHAAIVWQPSNSLSRVGDLGWAAQPWANAMQSVVSSCNSSGPCTCNVAIKSEFKVNVRST